MRCRLLAVCCALALGGCDQRPSRTTTTAGSSTNSPPRRARGFVEPAPPAAIQPPIRDNSARGELRQGAAIDVRLAVGTITTKDALGIALQLRPDKPIERGHPWLAEQLDWSAVIPTLRLEVKPESGAAVLLEPVDERKKPWQQRLADVKHELSIDGSGFVEVDRVAWKKPVPDLFAAPGNYTISISGSIETNARRLTFASAPIAFKVIAPSGDHKTLAELESIAQSIATKRVPTAKPSTTVFPVDDVRDNRWFRFVAYEPWPKGVEEGGSLERVVEILLSPAGKEVFVDEFIHSTCVAEGTRIATPRGDVPIERLSPGDEIVAYDVEKRKRTTAVVEHLERSIAERVNDLGVLRLTGGHPVLADGRWQRAGDLVPGAALLRIDGAKIAAPEPAIVEGPLTVYDLSVSPPHTYFAGGVLVHNKMGPSPIGGRDQPWMGWFYRRAARR